MVRALLQWGQGLIRSKTALTSKGSPMAGEASGGQQLCTGSKSSGQHQAPIPPVSIPVLSKSEEQSPIPHPQPQSQYLCPSPEKTPQLGELHPASSSIHVFCSLKQPVLSSLKLQIWENSLKEGKGKILTSSTCSGYLIPNNDVLILYFK